MILDATGQEQNGKEFQGNSEHDVVVKSTAPLCNPRPPLQDCTNIMVQRDGNMCTESSRDGKGQWKRRARAQGTDIGVSDNHEKIGTEAVKRKCVDMTPEEATELQEGELSGKRGKHHTRVLKPIIAEVGATSRNWSQPHK